MPSQKAWSLRTYRAATRLLAPIASIALARRLKAGKEETARLPERRGETDTARPEGKLLWLHGASVGESLSVLPLIDALGARYPELRFLVTTGTVTSADLMRQRLPERAIHQYIPLDQPRFVRAFLDHWRPDAAFFVESELWPNFLSQAQARNIPMGLINGRMSPKSFDGWRRRKGAARELLAGFDVIIGQNEENAERFATLSGRNVTTLGNLKLAAEPLPAPSDDVETIESWLDGRHRWLAASTHQGEEELVLTAHRAIQEQLPRAVLFLAPRHPARGDALEALCAAQGHRCVRRSRGEMIGPETDVYIADTLGELGIFYSLSDIAFVGGSFVKVGGHNPLEPARLGCAILHGPEVYNFADTYKDMRSQQCAALVRNDRDLSGALTRLLSDEKTRAAMADQARDWSDESAKTVLHALIDAVEPVLVRGNIAARAD